MTREEAVRHCKYWSAAIKKDGIDLLSVDRDVAVGLSDQLVYPLEMQGWIDENDEPELDEIIEYAVRVDNDYTRRSDWEKLTRLIDKIK